MRTNYYLTKENIQIKDGDNEIDIPKHTKLLGSLNSKTGMVTLFTKYWFQYPVRKLIRIENFTK